MSGVALPTGTRGWNRLPGYRRRRDILFGFRAADLELVDLATGQPISFSRASPGGLVPVLGGSGASRGIVYSGPHAHNVPRFMWQGGRPYLLVEPAGTNLIPANRRKFQGWTAFQGAEVTVTQGQTIPGFSPPGEATRIQTSGGDHVQKYYATSMGSRDGGPETQSIVISNIGTVALQISTNSGPPSVTIQPGETKYVVTSAATTAAGSSRQMQFRAPSAGDSLDFLAYAPQIEVSPVATSYIPGTDRAQDLVQANWSHGVISCTVLMAGISAGGDQGLIGTAGARLFQLGAGTSIMDRAFVIRAFPADGVVVATLGNGSAAVNSTGSAIPIGHEYIRAGALEIDTVARTGRVRLLQWHRETPGSGAWTDASAAWSNPLDVTPLLAQGWAQPAITIGNVYSGSRPGRLILSDCFVLPGIWTLDAACSRVGIAV